MNESNVAVYTQNVCLYVPRFKIHVLLTLLRILLGCYSVVTYLQTCGHFAFKYVERIHVTNDIWTSFGDKKLVWVVTD